MRTTIQQNLALRWVQLAALPELYALLEPAGLAKAGAEKLVDVTSCPGADTCQLGITSSRGMARTLSQQLDGELAPLADLDGVRVKISGCPNSCGQHHIAPIGLFGGAKKFGDKTVPTYQMMLGGSGGAVGQDQTPFGKAFLKIPASNVTAAVGHLVRLYQDRRSSGETFGAFIERYGWEKLKAEMTPFSELPPYEQAPEKYKDAATAQEEVGGHRENFEVKTGKGECGV
jgi:sulfite reductase (ferredoxin)